MSTRIRTNNPGNPFSDPAPPTNMSSTRTQHSGIVEAVRETVTVRGTESRSKPSRSHSSHPSGTNGGPQTMPTRGARSQSQDSILKAAAAVEKAKSGSKRPKKSSQHADVIDKLDFTGVGPMFHHDGPFDACAPSRNRSRAKAPMLAWAGANPNDTRALAAGSGNDGPYGAANLTAAFSDHYPPDPPRKKVDAIAESWGKHEPEPFEEFSAGGGTRSHTPASSIYNGRTNGSTTTTTSTRSGAAKPSSRSKDTAREGRRAALPPPQPIFVPDHELDPDLPIAQPSPGGGPKRSKSLMHRIRKMRDAPNMPVDDPDSPVTSEGSRPTHRSQNSFLGRFGGSSGKNNPGSPGVTSPGSETFVYIDDPRGAQDKDLPPPPPSSTSPKDSGAEDYFTPPSSYSYNNGGTTPGTPAGGLGRKQSLLSKVGRAVRGKQ